MSYFVCDRGTKYFPFGRSELTAATVMSSPSAAAAGAAGHTQSPLDAFLSSSVLATDDDDDDDGGDDGQRRRRLLPVHRFPLQSQLSSLSGSGSGSDSDSSSTTSPSSPSPLVLREPAGAAAAIFQSLASDVIRATFRRLTHAQTVTTHNTHHKRT